MEDRRPIDTSHMAGCGVFLLLIAVVTAAIGVIVWLGLWGLTIACFVLGVLFVWLAGRIQREKKR